MNWHWPFWLTHTSLLWTVCLLKKEKFVTKWFLLKGAQFPKRSKTKKFYYDVAVTWERQTSWRVLSWGFSCPGVLLSPSAHPFFSVLSNHWLLGVRSCTSRHSLLWISLNPGEQMIHRTVQWIETYKETALKYKLSYLQTNKQNAHGNSGKLRKLIGRNILDDLLFDLKHVILIFMPGFLISDENLRF